MSVAVDFEHFTIPAQLEEITERVKEVVVAPALGFPLGHYLQNMSRIRGMEALSLVVWQDQSDSRSLAITRFFNHDFKSAEAFATQELNRLVEIQLVQDLKDSFLEDFKIHTGWSYQIASPDQLETVIPLFQTWIVGDPWHTQYIRNRLLSVIAIPQDNSKKRTWF